MAVFCVNDTIYTASADHWLNPVHDDAAKWKLATNLRAVSSGINLKCVGVIVHYQTPYAETYEQDIRAALKEAGWEAYEFSSPRDLPRGLSLRSLDKETSRDCAEALKHRIENDLKSPSGGGVNASLDWVQDSGMNPWGCEGNPSCVEIDIGNDPASP